MELQVVIFQGFREDKQRSVYTFLRMMNPTHIIADTEIANTLKVCRRSMLKSFACLPRNGTPEEQRAWCLRGGTGSLSGCC